MAAQREQAAATATAQHDYILKRVVRGIRRRRQRVEKNYLIENANFRSR
jgi:hypothetical protein